MKKLKLGMSLMVLTIALTACGGPDWTRVTKAKSACIVGMSYVDELKSFDDNGGIGNDQSGNMGIGDGLGMLGGVLGGQGLSAVNDEINERNEAEKTTFSNIESFQTQSLSNFNSILKKNKYDVVKYDDVMDGIDIGDAALSQSLIEDSESDLILNIKNEFGYIAKDKNFGLSKEYRLAVKTHIQFSDKDRFIASRSYFVKSSKRKDSDGQIPAFTKDDFKSVQKALSIKIKTDLKQLRLSHPNA